MSTIDAYIAKHKLKPSDCLYHTQRTAKSSKGVPAGKIRVLVPKSGLAMVEYVCPECMHAGYAEQEWRRPFYVKCSACSYKLSVLKMRDEAKREAKSKK